MPPVRKFTLILLLKITKLKAPPPTALIGTEQTLVQTSIFARGALPMPRASFADPRRTPSYLIATQQRLPGMLPRIRWREVLVIPLLTPIYPLTQTELDPVAKATPPRVDTFPPLYFRLSGADLKSVPATSWATPRGLLGEVPPHPQALTVALKVRAVLTSVTTLGRLSFPICRVLANVVRSLVVHVLSLLLHRPAVAPTSDASREPLTPLYNSPIQLINNPVRPFELVELEAVNFTRTPLAAPVARAKATLLAPYARMGKSPMADPIAALSLGT